MSNLEIDERVKREKEAYNENDVVTHNVKLREIFNHVFTCPNTIYLEDFYWKEIEENAKNSVVLDYGCYTGDITKNLLKFSPKKVYGIDISDYAIDLAKKNHGNFITFSVCDAHHTDFNSNFFDLIIGNAIIHHLDYNTAIDEIYRILKPGGKAVFIEPLGDNPVAKLYRLVTPKARTKDEKPLSKKQILYANKFFKSSHLYANFISIPVSIITSFLFKKNSSNIFLKLAHKMDLFFEKTFLKYHMRYVVLVWEKK
jgi:ubiquinone/menaquinone biosynthesis C-methylase UbiE